MLRTLDVTIQSKLLPKCPSNPLGIDARWPVPWGRRTLAQCEQHAPFIGMRDDPRFDPSDLVSGAFPGEVSLGEGFRPRGKRA